MHTSMEHLEKQAGRQKRKNQKRNNPVEKIKYLLAKSINKNVEDIDWSGDFFLQYSWTKEQREKFKKDLINLCKTDKQFWEDCTNITYRNKKLLDKFAEEIIFIYGWKDSE